MQDTNPATGTTVWRTGLPGAVMGTPTLDGVGVLAVPTMPRQSGDISVVQLLAESNGRILRHHQHREHAGVFTAGFSADDYLFVASAGGANGTYRLVPG